MKKSQPAQEVGSAFELLEKSLAIVIKHWKLFVLVNILNLFTGFLALFTASDNPNNNEDLDYSASLDSLSGLEIGAILGIGSLVAIFIIVSIFLFVMNIKLQTSVAQGKSITSKELTDYAKNNFFKQLGLIICMGIIILIGLILFIVPGLIALSRIIFAPYIMANKNTGIFESLKASKNIYSSNKKAVWGLIGVFMIIVVAYFIASTIPIIGSLTATILIILFSLIIPLRYFQLKHIKGYKTHSLDSTAPPPVV